MASQMIDRSTVLAAVAMATFWGVKRQVAAQSRNGRAWFWRLLLAISHRSTRVWVTVSRVWPRRRM
jgi:hypothetical protein